MNKKRLQELNNRKMEQLEKLKIENEVLNYYNSYEYGLEEELSTRELLQEVISDVLKF